MRLFISTILTLFVSVTSFAVTTINIHVTDKDGNPVPNAKVEVKGVMPWEEDDFLRTIGVDYFECLESKGLSFEYDDFKTVPEGFEFEGDMDVDHENVYEELKLCGYFEDLDVWEEQMHKHEGRFKYEDVSVVKTDVNGYVRIEVGGYAEYRVAVSNSVRFFKDGAENLNMSVVTEADVVRMFFVECPGGMQYEKDWVLYVVKSNPYFDIRKSFPSNDRLLLPEDVLKYYPDIHDIRYFNRGEGYSKYFFSHGAYIHGGDDIPLKERSFFLNLEQGEYQFIYSSADGHIIVDDVDTRTVRSEWKIAFWKKDSEGKWMLYFFIDKNRDYKAKTPPDQIQIPTVITPYTVDEVNDDFMPGYEVEIFDCYGNLVCISANGWDGRKGSDLAPPGIYFYKVKLKDGRKRKGTVEVIKM